MALMETPPLDAQDLLSGLRASAAIRKYNCAVHQSCFPALFWFSADMHNATDIYQSTMARCASRYTTTDEWLDAVLAQEQKMSVGW